MALIASKIDSKTLESIAVQPYRTVVAELHYERALSGIELLARDETIRKIRIRNLLLGDELDSLNEKLCEEFERGDQAEVDLQNWQSESQTLKEKLERTLNELRFKSRELDSLKAELFSLQDVSADSTKLLTEKLSLARELANLKPELEHHRSQANANGNMLSEKLSLQRQLSTVEAELENEKRNLQRLTAEQSKNGKQNAQYEAQIEELRKDLAKEQRERQKAERTTSKVSDGQVEELKKELARERLDREMTERAASRASDEQIEKLRRELVNEKREHANIDKATSKVDNDRLEELKKELMIEKRERQKENKEAIRAEAEWKTQKAVLDDKLDQFRTKLRVTKERVKEVEAELQKAQSFAVVRSALPEQKAKNPRKRVITQMDPDAAIGTPGDAGPTKRGKRASSVVGEKSTFSITPFLNRTASLAPESLEDRQVDEEPDEADGPVTSIERVASPTIKRMRPAVPALKSAVLAPSALDKSNLKAYPPQRKKAAKALTLEKVNEEGEAGQDVENEIPAMAVNSMAMKEKPGKLSLKPKALNSFSSFRDASLPPQEKKKRKLFGGPAKTLFDEDGDNDGETVGVGRGGFGGVRAFGAFGGRGFGGISLLAGKSKSSLVVAADGFMFSPLKKDRKVMAAAAAM